MPSEYVDEISELQSLVRRHGSQYRLAKNLGVSPSLICAVLLRKKPVPPVLMRELGIERVWAYRKRAG